MWKYVLKRIVLALVTAVIILSISFILVKLLKYEKPLGTDSQKYSYYKHDVALGYVLDYPSPQENLGEQLWSYTDSDNMPHYFYETPILSQYASWVKNIFTKWDWGLSRKILPNNTAMKIIADGLPVTILLNVLSVIFSVPLGILLGIFAA
ncbi:MAG: hypothetical protein K2J85_01870, partial [Anaeroplasmataceae bacterium]|nr:hypothetical protein [Anaeroplasmataceae bacterium]